MKRVLLVGCGHMGGALLKGWLQADLGLQFEVVTPKKESLDRVSRDLTWHKDVGGVPEGTWDVIVFAVVPGLLPEILPQYRRLIGPEGLVVSIAAGQKVSLFRRLLGQETHVVRAMPNLGVAVEEGITGLYTDAELPEEFRDLVADMFESVGLITWLKEEGQFNALTAFTGCAPGYLFQLINDLTSVAVDMGLDPSFASSAARQVLIGAGAYMKSTTTPTV